MILWPLILIGFGKKLEGLNKFISISSHFSSDSVPHSPRDRDEAGLYARFVFCLWGFFVSPRSMTRMSLRRYL